MELQDLQAQWDEFGRADPMWAVITARHEQDHTWQSDEFFELGRTDVRRFLALLDRYGISTPRGSALDFGCGVGRLTQALAEEFESATGVDISSTMIEAARTHSRHPAQTIFIQNVADDLSVLPTASFDLVVTHIVLQHLQPDLALKYIAEFVRVLKPGGALLFQIPTARIRKRARYMIIRHFPTLVAAYRRLRYGVAPELEMHVVSPSAIAAAVESGGGRIMGVEHDTAAGEEFESSVFIVQKATGAGANSPTPEL